MDEIIMPTLRQIVENTGSGTYVRIGTAQGCRWIIHDTAWNICKMTDIDWLLDRPIYSICLGEAREANEKCYELKEGLAILVEGEEDGDI